MNFSNSIRHADELNLLKIIKYLCSTKIRYPMTIEQVKAWLNQFSEGPEKTLALLILRYLIYRTSDQLDSSLKQALKSAAIYFVSPGIPLEDIDWREVLNGNVMDLCFNYGPPRDEHSPPGKSGEIISRQLKRNISLNRFNLMYPDMVTSLQPKERYLLVDDGTFTGTQLIDFIKYKANFLINNKQAGIVVGLVHQQALDNLSEAYPTLPIFYGEKITDQECFVSMCSRWIEDEMWIYSDVNPIDLYKKIVKKAKFHNTEATFGFGDLGCMVAYEHGVPDNSLQLLWDESTHWQPLINK